MNDFGIKYVGKQHLDHFTGAIKQSGYGVEIDKTGSLYYRITLERNYKQQYVGIYMPGYDKKIIAQFKNEVPMKPQYSTYQPPPHKYGKESQETLPEETTLKVNAEKTKIVQQVICGMLYYACAVDCTVLAAVSSIASDRSQATKGTEKKSTAAFGFNHKAGYNASEMVLNIYSDAFYLSEA